MKRYEKSEKDTASFMPTPNTVENTAAVGSLGDASAQTASENPKKANKKPLTPKQQERALRRQKKKLRKAEKKEARRKKKEAKKNRFVLYDPSKMQGFTLSLPIGYFLRFFSIGFSLFGVLWLFCDAFALTQVQAIPLLLYCVGMVSAFSMLFIGKWLTLAGFGLLLAWVGGFFAFCGNLLTFYVSGVGKVFNAMMYRLTEEGFAAAGSITLPDFGGLPYDGSRETILTYGGVFALATVFALVFAAFSAKRTRLFPMLILGGGLCMVCFTYNLCRTNWGIACVLAGLCSAVVLSAYDKAYKFHKQSKKSRAYSGYSSALAGLLALLIAALPAAAMQTSWREIEFISRPIEEARTLITTILTGGNPAYNKMNTLNERRSNKLENVEFENVTLFTVESPVNHVVYLRSWIGGDYDYVNDEWVALSSTDYSTMLRLLTCESSGFTGDQVTYDLYSLLSSEFTDGTFQERGYLSNPKFGYAAAFVDIEYVNNTGLLFVLPSAYVSPYGVYEYGSRTEYYSNAVSLHADGMWTSGWFNLKKSYTTAGVLPSYYTVNYGETAARQVTYYQLLIDEVTALHQKNIVEIDRALADFRQKLDSQGLSEFSTDALKQYLEQDRNGKARWYNRYVRLVREYSEYVADAYSAYPTESQGIRTLLKELKPDLEKATTTHDKVMVVIEYLTGHYSYTYTPTQPENPKSGALDAFLTETKDGYCVQFASAATLLLRAAGLPARYVQGYVASEFSSHLTDDGGLSYTAKVKDTDAHAWVEVYIDGLGWRTYEATSLYYDSLYYVDAGDTTHPGETNTSRPQVTTTRPVPETTAPVTSATELPADTTADDGITSAGQVDMAQILRIAIGLLVIGLLTFLLLWQVKRARKVVDGRRHFIERSIYGTFEEKSDFDRVAAVLCDSIFEVHAIVGNRPYVGELPGEFAARIDRLPENATLRQQRLHGRLLLLPNTMSEIMVLLQKQEFGKALNRQELEVLGSYLSALIDSEYASLNIFKKIWYRYIRFMI